MTGDGGGLALFCGDGETGGAGAVREAGVDKSDLGDSDGREERGVLAGDGGVMKTVRLPALPIIGGGGGGGEGDGEEEPIGTEAEARELGLGGGAVASTRERVGEDEGARGKPRDAIADRGSGAFVR